MGIIPRSKEEREYALQFTAAQKARLMGCLWERADVESTVYMVCGVTEGRERTTLVGREVVPVPDDAYKVRTAGRLVIDRPFVLPLLLRCADEGLAMLEIHTHPGERQARFSPVDDASDARKFRETAAVPGRVRHATAVMAQDGTLAARIWDRAAGRPRAVGSVTVVDRVWRRRALEGAGPPAAIPDPQAAVFDRQVRAFGREGQAVLAGLTVALVGAGGLGGQIALPLALLGVGHLIMVDPDRLEASNANRQVGVIGAQVRAGMPKVEAVAAGLARLAVPPRVTAVMADATDPAAWPYLFDADLVVGAVDSHAVRDRLNALSACALLPYLDGGVGIEAREGRIALAGGQVRAVLPGLTACLACAPTGLLGLGESGLAGLLPPDGPEGGPEPEERR